MKLQRFLQVGLLVEFAMAAQGCYSLKHVGTPVQESIEITNAERMATTSHFEQKKTIHHFIGGLVSPDDVGLEKMVSDAVKTNNGKGAVNVRIKYQQTFVNGFVGVITFGIYTPFTLTVTGDVVN